MAPNLELRSDSWLDLSAAVRSYGSWSSITGTSTGSRKIIDDSKSSSNSTSNESRRRNNSDQHLLIRLRQNCYKANRSQSTTLSSSRLSSSQSTSEFSSSLAEALARFGRPESCYLRDEGDGSINKIKKQPGQIKSPDPSRQQDSRERIATSPFVRSLSSFSHRLSGQFSQLRHTCKHLLQKYHERFGADNQQEEAEDDDSTSNRYIWDSVPDHTSAGVDRHASVPPDFIADRRRTSKRVASIESEPKNSRLDVRQRLTKDWVINHHCIDRNATGERARSESKCIAEGSQGDSKFERRRRRIDTVVYRNSINNNKGCDRGRCCHWQTDIEKRTYLDSEEGAALRNSSHKR